MKELILEKTGRKTKLRAGDFMTVHKRSGDVSFHRTYPTTSSSRLLFNKISDGGDDKVKVCCNSPWNFVSFISAIVGLNYVEQRADKDIIIVQFVAKK